MVNFTDSKLDQLWQCQKEDYSRDIFEVVPSTPLIKEAHTVIHVICNVYRHQRR